MTEIDLIKEILIKYQGKLINILESYGTIIWKNLDENIDLVTSLFFEKYQSYIKKKLRDETLLALPILKHLIDRYISYIKTNSYIYKNLNPEHSYWNWYLQFLKLTQRFNLETAAVDAETEEFLKAEAEVEAEVEAEDFKKAFADKKKFADKKEVKSESESESESEALSRAKATLKAEAVEPFPFVDPFDEIELKSESTGKDDQTPLALLLAAAEKAKVDEDKERLAAKQMDILLQYQEYLEISFESLFKIYHPTSMAESAMRLELFTDDFNKIFSEEDSDLSLTTEYQKQLAERFGEIYDKQGGNFLSKLYAFRNAWNAAHSVVEKRVKVGTIPKEKNHKFLPSRPGSLKKMETARELLQQTTECSNTYFDYVNKKLGIAVMGMSQPRGDIDSCMKIITKYNVKYFITLNNQGGHRKTFLQETLFYHKNCPACYFFSIPVVDFTAPTWIQLIDFWKILDKFHSQRLKDPSINILIHCTGGTGRTPFMIMSYICYKLFNKNSKKSITEMFKEASRMNPDNVETTLSFLNANKTIKYLLKEIEAYADSAVEELLQNKVLLKKRLMVMLEACLLSKNYL